MSVILQPQTAFPLVRQIANHLDATTYYVRAVVRDAAGQTIDTVALASQGSQRYQTSWQVPADPSGQGRYISVVTSVYTDSGYTTKSDNYGDEETTYLIFDRVMPAMRGGGSGGIDSRTLRRVIAEELDKRAPEPIQFPKQPEMRWGEVLTAIREATEAIRAIPTDKVDLSGVLRSIEALAAKIDAKEVTPETDLTPVLEAIKDAQKSIGEGFADLATIYQSAERDLLEKVGTTIEGAMDSLELTIAPTVSNLQKKPKTAEPSPIDISQLAL